ncbi:MAG TPA: DUF5723 family protein [Prolixibacteraceae bacterium]|nr:DUF5723 family protein [Prolixibacteraceae bacterium]
MTIQQTRNTIATLLIIFLCISTIQAQENILYFMGNSPQSTHLNPAIINDQSKLTIGIPLLAGQSFSLNNSFTISEITTVNQNTLYIDLDKMNEKAEDKNHLWQRYTSNLADIQWRRENDCFSFSITGNQLLNGSFNNNIISLASKGNAPLKGKPIHSNFDVNFIHYREFALGYNRNISEKLTLGGKLKFLTGLSAVDVQKMELTLETSADVEYANINAEGNYRLSLPTSMRLENNKINNPFNYLTTASNYGLAADLGVNYLLNPKIELSASIINLGFIRWKNEAKTVSHNGSFAWKGFDLSNMKNLIGYEKEPYTDPFQAFKDSVKELVNFREANNPFTTGIPMYIYFATGYTFSESFKAGIVDQVMVFDKQTRNSLTLSGNLNINRFASISAGYSIIDKSFANLSIGTAIKLGPVQIYLLTDNILAINVANSNTFNIRAGANLMFGTIEKAPVKTKKHSTRKKNSHH